MLLLFSWQDLRTYISEFDAGHGYDRSMPYIFEICRILHQDFWLMQMDLCLDLELGMGNYLTISFAEVLVLMRRNFVLLGLSLSLDPVIQADTAIR